jgi:hypothetical protein
MLKKVISAVVLLGFGMSVWVASQPVKQTDLVSPITNAVITRQPKG